LKNYTSDMTGFFTSCYKLLMPRLLQAPRHIVLTGIRSAPSRIPYQLPLAAEKWCIILLSIST